MPEYQGWKYSSLCTRILTVSLSRSLSNHTPKYMLKCSVDALARRRSCKSDRSLINLKLPFGST